MTSKLKLRLFFICVVVVIVGIVSFSLSNDDPTYNGYRLSELIELYDSSVGTGARAERKMASQTLFNTGTNAIPILIKWVQNGAPPRLFWELRAFAKKLTGKSYFSRRAYRADAAMHAFRALGTNADRAIPQLTQLMFETNNPNLSARAADALGWMQRESAIPSLVAVLTNDYAPNSLKATAANALHYAGTNAATAVPVLIKCLESTNTHIAGEAAWTLGELRLRPDLVVPALVTMMHRNDLKKDALFALGEFGTQATNATAMIMLALRDPDAEVRNYASNTLESIAPSHFANILSK